MIEVSPAATAEDWQAASGLVAEYLLSFQSGPAPCLHARDHARLAALRSTFDGSGSALLVARVTGAPVGCCGLQSLEDDTAELKRLYVRPHMRRRGVGRKLLAAAVDHAARLGYQRLLLDVVPDRAAAIGFYQRSGSHRVAHWEGRLDMLAFELPLASGSFGQLR